MKPREFKESAGIAAVEWCRDNQFANRGTSFVDGARWALTSSVVRQMEEALMQIKAYEPTKGLVKVMPLEAIKEINAIAREALAALKAASGGGDE